MSMDVLYRPQTLPYLAESHRAHKDRVFRLSINAKADDTERKPKDFVSPPGERSWFAVRHVVAAPEPEPEPEPTPEIVEPTALVPEPIEPEPAPPIVQAFLPKFADGFSVVRYIFRLVAGHYNVSLIDVLSQRRTANLVRPRQVGMYVAKKITRESMPTISRACGGRDHTTALHGVRKIARLIAEDSDLRKEIDDLSEVCRVACGLSKEGDDL